MVFVLFVCFCLFLHKLASNMPGRNWPVTTTCLETIKYLLSQEWVQLTGGICPSLNRISELERVNRVVFSYAWMVPPKFYMMSAHRFPIIKAICRPSHKILVALFRHNSSCSEDMSGYLALFALRSMGRNTPILWPILGTSFTIYAKNCTSHKTLCLNDSLVSTELGDIIWDWDPLNVQVSTENT